MYTLTDEKINKIKSLADYARDNICEDVSNQILNTFSINVLDKKDILPLSKTLLDTSGKHVHERVETFREIMNILTS